MEYLNGQDCSLLLTATGEQGVHRGPKPEQGWRAQIKTPARMCTEVAGTQLFLPAKGPTVGGGPAGSAPPPCPGR